MVSAKKKYYYDHAATSPITTESLKQLYQYFQDYSYNSGTVYENGLISKKALEQTRLKFKNLLGSKQHELIFTSGGTESNNLGIHSLSSSIKDPGICWYSKTAHPSLVKPALNLVNKGWSLHSLPILSSGHLDLEACVNLPTPDIVVIEWVNSEVGFIQDIQGLQKLMQKKNTESMLMLDAVQGLGKIDLPNLNSISAISFSGHKLGAPVGIGALFIKNIQKQKALQLGGDQEFGIRSGTVSVPLALSFLDALSTQSQHKGFRELNFSNLNIKSIREVDKNYSPYIYLIDTSPVEGEVLLHNLENENILVGLGSACSASKKKMSLCHQSLGFTETQSRCTIRLSFMPDSNLDEAQRVLEKINETVQNLIKYFK